MHKHAKHTATALVLALSLAGAAQAQDLSSVGQVLGKSLGLSSRGKAAPASALRFSSQAAVTRKVNQRLAQNLSQTLGQAGKAQAFQTLFDGGVLQQAVGEAVSKLGWRKDDLADVLGASVLMGWQAVHGQQAPRGAAESVRSSMQHSLLNSGWLGQLDDAGKQALAETVGTSLMFLLANLETAKPADQAEARRAIRGMLRSVLGVDVETLKLSGGAAAPSAAAPAREAAPARAPQPQSPDAVGFSGKAKGVPVERVLLMKESAVGYGGYTMTVYNPYVLFDNGTVVSKPAVAPEDLDHSSRDRQQGRWGKWDSSWGTLRIVWDGSAAGTKPTEKSASAPECHPAGRNGELKGHWEAVGGSGSIAVGGDVGVLNTSDLFFDDDGNFSNRRLTTITAPNAAAHAKRGALGRYRLSGYTLQLQFEQGAERRLFYCAMDKGNKVLQIGNRAYVRQ